MSSLRPLYLVYFLECEKCLIKKSCLNSGVDLVGQDVGSRPMGAAATAERGILLVGASNSGFLLADDGGGGGGGGGGGRGMPGRRPNKSASKSPLSRTPGLGGGRCC